MNISFSEIIVILLVALLVIKPEHLPATVKKLSQFIKWFRVVTTKIKREMEEPFQQMTSEKHEPK